MHFLINQELFLCEYENQVDLVDEKGGVRPPLTVEETGPHFNHCHISDIWNNMSGS